MITTISEDGKKYINGLITEYNLNEGEEFTNDTLESVLNQLLELDELPENDKNRVRRIHYRLFVKTEEDLIDKNTPWKREGR